MGIMVRNLIDKFPIFSHKRDGRRLVYLDSAATTQKPQAVIDAVSSFYSTNNATVHRGIYALSEHSTEQYELVREKLAKFINAKEACEIIFTSGATEGINFVADTWGRANVKADDEIVLTRAEHHANLLPWQRLAQQTGAKIRFMELDKETFMIDAAAVKIISPKTKIVALTHISNVLGNVWSAGQLETIIARAREVGAVVLLDAAQSVAHQPIDVQKLNPDFLVFSGHKMFAPTGVGVLYIAKRLHASVEPYRVGGSMVYEASYEKAMWLQAPQKFEAGTPAIEAVIGLGAAVDFINKEINFQGIQKHEAALCAKLLDGLKTIHGCAVFGNEKMLRHEGHLVTFVLDGIHAHDVAAELDRYNIAVRAGHHCAQPLAGYLGIDVSVRASFSVYNVEADVEAVVVVLREIVKKFRS